MSSQRSFRAIMRASEQTRQAVISAARLCNGYMAHNLILRRMVCPRCGGGENQVIIRISYGNGIPDKVLQRFAVMR